MKGGVFLWLVKAKSLKKHIKETTDKIFCRHFGNHIGTIVPFKEYDIPEGTIKIWIRKARESELFPDHGTKCGKFNEKWCSNITHLVCNRSRDYLSSIIDLYDKKIVVYVISRSNDNN